MTESLFVSHNVRCKHGIILPAGKNGCTICERVDEMMARKPPFTVELLEACYPLEKGQKYTVVVCVKDGKATLGTTFPGIMLKAENGLAVAEVFAASRFRMVD
jgi:hypothetical protein